METDEDDDDDENEVGQAHISEGSEEEEEEDEEAVNQTGSYPPASELERISTSELTNESQEDPNGNGECDECPPSESAEESELILSPGLQFLDF